MASPKVKKEKRARVDWDAIRRDYRIGKFTDGELADKHGVSREAIVRRRKREPENWPQDLTEAVKQATNAALDAAMVTDAITEGHTKVTDTVLAVAEVNKQVILGHQKDAKEARSAMDKAMATVLKCGAEIKGIREAAVFASAVESLSRTAKNAADMERKAFRLDDDKPPPTGPTEFVVRYLTPEHAPDH